MLDVGFTVKIYNRAFTTLLRNSLDKLQKSRQWFSSRPHLSYKLVSSALRYISGVSARKEHLGREIVCPGTTEIQSPSHSSTPRRNTAPKPIWNTSICAHRLQGNIISPAKKSLHTRLIRPNMNAFIYED